VRNYQYQQKPKDQDFLSSWLFQRRIAKPFVLLLAPTKITPNQISLISVLVGLIGIILLSFGTPLRDFLAVIILHIAAIIDCIDGDLARTRNTAGTLHGKFADFVKTLMIDPLIPIMLAVGLVNTGSSIWWLIAILIVSFWKIAPQFSREHVVIRSLEKYPELPQNKLAETLFTDPQQQIKRQPEHRSLFQQASRIVNLIIGLPNAMLNTLLLLTGSGAFLLNFRHYTAFKNAFLALVIASYFVYSLKALILEFGKLKHFDNTGFEEEER
jgi:hypothetical protein